MTELTFDPDVEKQCFQVPVLVDQLDEYKDFIAEIKSVPDGVTSNQPRSVTISILDSHGTSIETSTTDYNHIHTVFSSNTISNFHP